MDRFGQASPHGPTGSISALSPVINSRHLYFGHLYNLKQFYNIWGMHSCLGRLTHIAVADPDGELPIPKVWAPSYFLAIFCLNLHQIEKKMDRLEDARLLYHPHLPPIYQCIIYLLVEGRTHTHTQNPHTHTHTLLTSW